MGIVTESSVFTESVYAIEETDPVLGGEDGYNNRSAEDLANRTRWLKDQVDAISATLAVAGLLPLGALPYPTVSTEDNRLTIAAAAASNGGTVSVAADQRLAIAASEATGTGRLLSLATAAWQSADLATNATYYLRAQVADGALLLYTQRGTDADPIPAGLLGTKDAVSAGGFDSTVLDALLAKIVTSNAGTVPTVTALANAARLHTQVTEEARVGINVNTHVINWARSPLLAMQGQTAPPNSRDSDYEFVATATRYSVNVTAKSWNESSPTVQGPGYTYTVFAI